MSQMKFNERGLAALKPENKDHVYWDESFKGNRNGRFGLRVYPSGAKRYLYDYVSDTGERRRIVIGDFNYLELATARHIAKGYALEISQGKNPQQDRIDRRNSITFAELVDKFIKFHCNVKLKPKTTKNYLQILNKDLLPAWSNRRISDITKKHIQAILGEIVVRSAIMQAERTREVISTIFRFAVTQGDTEQNPCNGVEEIARTKPRTRKLNHIEVAKFWAACDKLKSIKMRNYFKILLLTAQRRGEIGAAKWSDIETYADGEIWNFPQTKSGRPHSIPISSLVKQLLTEVKTHNEKLKARSKHSDKSRYDEYIFPSKYAHAKRHITEIRKSFQVIGTEMKVEAFVPHDLRRTAATLMRELGIRHETLKKILNHASTGVTGIHYDQYDEMPEMQLALSTLAEGILEMTRGNYIRGKRRA